MDSKPLSYESLKSVLQYMEANQRFQLSHRVPSIRSAEKAVPLSINYLCFMQNSFLVNNTSYQLGVIRHFTDGQPHPHVERMNANGGVNYDLDRFGGEDGTVKRMVTPGDVLLEAINEARNDDEYVQELEQYLVELQGRYEDESDQILIDETEDELQSLYYRRKNAEPLYKTYIQLTIVKSNGEKKIETVNYAKRLYEATKYLTTQFFGKRKTTMTVNKLALDWFCEVIRFPEMTKIKVRNLVIDGNVASIMSSLETLLDKKSFPLHSVRISNSTGFEEVQNYEHSVITTANELFLNGIPFDVFLKTQNPKVHVENSSYTSEQLIISIDEMIEDAFEIGTTYSCEVKNSETVIELFELLASRLNVTVQKNGRSRTDVFPNTYTLPLTDYSEINIVCTKKARKYKNDDSKSIWTVWFLVEPRNATVEVKKNAVLQETKVRTVEQKKDISNGPPIEIIIFLVYFIFLHFYLLYIHLYGSRMTCSS